MLLRVNLGTFRSDVESLPMGAHCSHASLFSFCIPRFSKHSCCLHVVTSLKPYKKDAKAKLLTCSSTFLF
jgi:hypothetical protein